MASKTTTKNVVEEHPELLPIKNAIYLGNYGMAVSKAGQISFEGEEDAKKAEIERDVLMYRAHIGLQQYDLVLKQIEDKPSTPLPLQAVRLLASYYSSNFTNGKQCIEKLEQWGQDPAFAADPTLAVVGATIFSNENDLISALKSVHNPTTLEMAALQVSLFIQLHRLDFAQEALKKMIEMNDDATLTQLTAAYLAVARGGEKLQEATYIFKDLLEKYEESVTLLNGIASCQLQTGNFVEAEKTLLTALGKRSSDPETLINLIVCAQHLRKPKDLISRYVVQLKNIAPNHPWVRAMNEAEDQFELRAQQFKPRK